MSLNQLPDELVTQMSTHLGDKDIVNLLQTQKRVNRILRKAKMDKFKVEGVYLNFGESKFYFITHDEDEHSISNLPEDIAPEKLVGLALSKFQPTANLVIGGNRNIHLDTDLASAITNSKEQYKTLSLYIDVDLKPEEFVEFSRTSALHSLTCFENRPDIYCDDVLCKIVYQQEFNFDMCFLEEASPDLVERITGDAIWNISDRLLEAMSFGKKPQSFILENVRTNFTINGIRRFIEECVEKGDEIKFYFGILGSEQIEPSIEWMQYADEEPDVLYTMEVEEDDDDYDYQAGQDMVIIRSDDGKVEAHFQF